MTRITVFEDVVSSLDIGIGWNSSACIDRRWPEYLGSGTGGDGPLVQRAFSQEDWDRYFGLMEWSGCNWLRHSISIADWEQRNERLERHHVVLAQAEKRGIKVLLANWDLGAKRPAARRQSHHPDNEDEFCAALAAIVHDLKRVKNYSCVWALSLWNEPDDRLAYSGPKANYPDSFWPLYRIVDSHLRRLGVRDDVLLFGPDTSTGGHPVHIPKMLERYGPVLDVIGDHDYSAFRGKAMFRSVAAYSRLMRDLNAVYGRRVPFVISEFGNYGCGSGALDSDEEVYSGALSTAAYLIRMVNHGAAGLARWEFLIYGNKWRNFGALTNTDQDYFFRPYGPVFYPHAITARYVKPGWKVRRAEARTGANAIWATALTSKDGDLTLLLLNDDVKSLSVQLTVKISSLPDQLHQLMVTGPPYESIAREKDIRLDHGQITCVLPPKSITAVTSLPPGDLELPKSLALRRT